MSLNKEQSTAVSLHHGHICVVAGAGSGKTKVLTERIVNMIQSGISPDGILAFTFTKKAAEEMKERLNSLFGNDSSIVDRMFVGTIHSLFNSVLSSHLKDFDKAYSRGYSLIQDWQQKKILKSIHDKNLFIRDGMGEKEALRVIGKAKNMGFSVDDLAVYLDSQGSERIMVDYFCECYHQYELHKRSEALIDFDDMLFLSKKIFNKDPKVLDKWQSKFTHISIDEYQDINPLQESLIHQLQGKCENLFVVGDPKQSIYSFRASDPSFILNFSTKYPNCKIITLNKNYRCAKTIMDHANSLISYNPEGDEMKAELKIKGNVDYLGVYMTASEEAEAIANRIVEHNEDGAKWKDFAVLYRCNHQSRAIEDALIRMQVPYEVIGNSGFYNRAEIKDMLAYLEIANEARDFQDMKTFGRIVNKPTRYLGAKFTEELFSQIGNYDDIIDCLSSHNFRTVNKRSNINVVSLTNDIINLSNLTDQTPSSCISYIRDKIGYDKWLVENRNNEVEDDTEVLSNLNEFSASSSNFKTVGTMLSYVADIQRRYSNGDKNNNKVKLMSLHRAKGLEFPIVFMSGMSDVLLPHSKSQYIEEERRLAYVGVTRAQQTLYVSYFESMRDRFVGASSFLTEMGVDIDG